MASAPQNKHRKSIQQLQDRTKDLLARIASQEADNASLQKTKAATAAKLRNAHTTLTTTSTSLTSLTVSYAKRLEEKNRLISDNADLELTNSDFRNTIAAQLRTISENETQIRDLQKENRDLMDRLGMLEREMAALKPRVEQLDAEDRTRMRQPRGDQPPQWRSARSTYTGRGGGYRSQYENTRERGNLARAREEDRGSLRTRSRVGGYDRNNANRPPRSASPREGGDGGK
ncbi:hypothetical protein IAQ61_002478 [Plenodomus lingam]|uniref:uncharacterized protein n=1 Tax=Leptosphaeria maculans TaxID=5022 RepID=UPI003328B7D8|nr:hypothetical protein IAQ61_002478 [Plenodomus lingam]